jgi:hypothetical protein
MSDPSYPEQEGMADWFEDVVKRSTSTSEEYLDLAVVTYGSLLHPQEIKTLFHHEHRIVEPIRVEGFSRHFSKSVASHLRDVEGEKSGVLNVHPNRNDWFNGLFIGPLSGKGLRKYAFREREYDVTYLESDQLELYSKSDRLLDRFEAVFTCYLDPTADEVSDYEPEPDYLDLCLEGAEQWGESFLEQFKTKTFVGEKRLAEYLD